jgi:hypothetical protein
MNEDRLSEVVQKLDAKMQKIDDFVGLKSADAHEQQVSLSETAAQADVDYIEHSFGGVPIPKAPVKLVDMSGMIVTDHDDADNLLLGS